MSNRLEKPIFEYSRPGRGAIGQWPQKTSIPADLPAHLRRRNRPLLPEVSELVAVRHFKRLSQLNFSIDTHFYPLGSCTMKYNPKACNQYALLPEFTGRHPLAPESHGQGFPACMYELHGNAEGSHRHARRLADADGGRARRDRRRGDDPRLSPRARRPRAQ